MIYAAILLLSVQRVPKILIPLNALHVTPISLYLQIHFPVKTVPVEFQTVIQPRVSWNLQ